MASAMTVRDIDLNKCEDELSTDEVNKIATVLNNSCQFKISAHVLNRSRSAQDITVVYEVTSKESSSNVMVWWVRSTSMSPTVSTGFLLRTIAI